MKAKNRGWGYQFEVGGSQEPSTKARLAITHIMIPPRLPSAGRTSGLGAPSIPQATLSRGIIALNSYSLMSWDDLGGSVLGERIRAKGMMSVIDSMTMSAPKPE